MGGSGSSGGWTPPRSGCNSGADKCDLRFQTDLFGPQPAVVASLSPGDQLTIQLVTQGQSSAVAALTAAGQVAGTITGIQQLGTLVDCLTDNSYSAQVLAINGPKVTILVERD